MECLNSEVAPRDLEEDFVRMKELERDHINVSKEPGALRITYPDSFVVDDVQGVGEDRYRILGPILLPEKRERVILYVDRSLAQLPSRLKSVA